MVPSNGEMVPCVFGLYTVLLMVTTISSIAARHITETWLCLDASPEKNSSNNQPTTCSWPYVCTYAAIWSIGFIAYECICIHNRAYSNVCLSLLQTGIQTIYLATNSHPNITTSLSTTWLFYCVSLARFAHSQSDGMRVTFLNTLNHMFICTNAIIGRSYLDYHHHSLCILATSWQKRLFKEPPSSAVQCN